ncbi:IS110 family transposase [Candidatus Caldatribacterium saccharofermentans]|uniref:IS110 family transposase n=1 Tax=Candidatus Caldatribacterium saccharofermentans TaxID=1454753 RepID=UPI003D075069
MGNKVVVGIDVGKESYAVSVFDGRAYLFQGLTPAHPETFLKRVTPHLPQDAAEVLFVMEATGVYSLKLALFLVQGGHRVSVVNPFVVRKYAEMRLRRTKTDPADSRILAQFGFFASPSPFHPQEEKAYHLRQVLKAIDDYQKRRTEILNHLETLKHHPFPQPKVCQYYEQELQRVEETLQALEKEAEDLALQYAPREYRLLLSIPGVGKRLACAILGILSPLTRFRNGKELASFLGLAPQIDQSGKRKERAWLSKRGNPFLRKLLFLAALSASRFNEQCRVLYERLIARGKPKKVALIAVANKLLRQIFAILRSGIPYDPHYLERKRSFAF